MAPKAAKHCGKRKNKKPSVVPGLASDDKTSMSEIKEQIMLLGPELNSTSLSLELSVQRNKEIADFLKSRHRKDSL